MGCGSSSTQVKEPRKVEDKRSPILDEKHSESVNHSQKQVVRSGASSTRNSRVKSKSTSSSSSSISDRVNSAISDRHKSEQENKKQNDVEPVGAPVTKENFDDATKSEPTEGNDDDKNEVNKTKLINDLQSDDEGIRSVQNETKQFNDEKTDVTNESDVDKEKQKLEEQHEEFQGLDFKPIIVPEVDPTKQMNDYTIDDIVNNNAEKGRNNWFIYGKKVYSLDLFIPIVNSRIEQYLQYVKLDNYLLYNLPIPYEWFDNPPSAHKLMTGPYPGRYPGTYPIYCARLYGVRRKELNTILPTCKIGNLSALPRDEYLSRLKHCVDNVKSDLETEENLTENLVDYLEQLSRWVSNYPNVELEIPLDRTNVDPNECEFPLPDKIRADCSVLQQWAVDWIPFDLTFDGDVPWTVIPLLKEDWGDTHQIYADIISKRVDETLPDFNLEIEGEAAWSVIKVDIVKNDETTEEQDKLLKVREQRNDFNDPERMRRRRNKIAESFLLRHEKRLKPEDMIPYKDWATRLEQHWKEFQELCESEFIRPQQTYEPEKLADESENKPKALPESIPPHDTQSLLSEHGTI